MIIIPHRSEFRSVSLPGWSVLEFYETKLLNSAEQCRDFDTKGRERSVDNTPNHRTFYLIYEVPFLIGCERKYDEPYT